MYNTNVNNNISIEQFAAFLDGNLPSDEMTAVAAVIDQNQELSDIIGETMIVDDAIELILQQPNEVVDELTDADWIMPEIPGLTEADDTVVLRTVESEDVVLVATTEEYPIHVEDGTNTDDLHKEIINSVSLEGMADDFVNMPIDSSDETIDFGDLA